MDGDLFIGNQLPFRFGANKNSPRRHLTKVGGNSGSTSSTANGEYHEVDLLFFYIFQDLDSDCSLSFNYLLIVEGMREYSFFFSTPFLSCLKTLIKRVPE